MAAVWPFFSVKNLPLSYAICLNFASPIVASIGAKIILQEKLTLSDIGGMSAFWELFNIIVTFLQKLFFKKKLIIICLAVVFHGK